MLDSVPILVFIVPSSVLSYGGAELYMYVFIIFLRLNTAWGLLAHEGTFAFAVPHCCAAWSMVKSALLRGLCMLIRMPIFRKLRAEAKGVQKKIAFIHTLRAACSMIHGRWQRRKKRAQATTIIRVALLFSGVLPHCKNVGRSREEGVTTEK